MGKPWSKYGMPLCAAIIREKMHNQQEEAYT